MVKERLMEFLHHERMSQVEFTRKLGVSSTYVSAMRRGISSDKILKLRNLFPNLNTNWLLYGEGEMLLSDTPERIIEEGVGQYEVPLLPVSAYAGNIQAWSESVLPSECERVVSPVKGADFAIRVSGDSMEPVLHDGVTILIKRINEAAFIPWGNNMVIDTENGVLVKAVYPGADTPPSITAKSLNPKYPPFEIPKASIYALYRILGAVDVFSTM